MNVRPAERRDAEAMATIYNQGIEDRQATFETAPRSAEQMGAMIENAHGRPVLIAERGGGGGAGDLLGFAAAHEYRPRACYAGVAEASVYVARAARGAGAGRALLDALAAACEARGMWKLVGRIFSDNRASRALCARAGFREVGVYLRHGRLDGAWRDNVIVERLLGEALSEDPPPGP